MALGHTSFSNDNLLSGASRRAGAREEREQPCIYLLALPFSVGTEASLPASSKIPVRATPKARQSEEAPHIKEDLSMHCLGSNARL